VRNLDFTSWQALLSTLLGLSLITLIGVGIRLLVMQTIQQRRERENRQINERLKTLIAAYRTLGGSFTGSLVVDPTHLRDLKQTEAGVAGGLKDGTAKERAGSDRSRRIRDAVEAALSDIVLLGTEEQVKLAAVAATELAAGRAVETGALVVSLRNFVREVLDLEPVSSQLAIPKQGPSRSTASKGNKDADGGKQGGGGQGGGQGGGMGGGGAGFGGASSHDDEEEHQHE
jgi:uncharacterized membrane protein YgcG